MSSSVAAAAGAGRVLTKDRTYDEFNRVSALLWQREGSPRSLVYIPCCMEVNHDESVLGFLECPREVSHRV